MTAKELKRILVCRYPGGSFAGMPNAWTCIEEYRGIDLLAWSAWSSASRFARIGHEVKVSRADLRRELLRPQKRAFARDWCHEFYFAVPNGLLTAEELAYEEPEWDSRDFLGERCPGIDGDLCRPRSPRTKKHMVSVPVSQPQTEYVTSWNSWDYAICSTCKGKGVISPSRVERESPTCWVPRDIGLIVVSENSSRLVKRSPRRKDVPPLTDRELGQLVRWVSMRPDPRHNGRPPSALSSN